MVIQLVSVSIVPEQRDRWLELIRMNAAQTRAEQGCESYQVGEDVETPNTFSIVERWTSLGAQYSHFRNPQFGELMGALSDVLAGPPEVSISEVASTQSLAPGSALPTRGESGAFEEGGNERAWRDGHATLVQGSAPPVQTRSNNHLLEPARDCSRRKPVVRRVKRRLPRCATCERLCQRAASSCVQGKEASGRGPAGLPVLVHGDSYGRAPATPPFACGCRENPRRAR